MFYLVGSYALTHYGVDLGREPNDVDVYRFNTYYNPTPIELDFIKPTEKGTIYSDKNGIIYDVFSYNLWETDKLFESMQGERIELFGYKFTVAPKEVLYIMYRTTAEVYKDEKSLKDFAAIEKAWPNLMFRWELYEKRLKETQDYYNKKKEEFFKEHKVNYFIDHDKIHEIVTKSYRKGSPLYKGILNDLEPTKISTIRFNNLGSYDKILLLAEEICVLLFERYFIYKTVTKGFKEEYVKNFFDNGKNSVTNKLIHHVCEKGLKGEHPEIIKFARDNIKEISENVYYIKSQLKSKPLPDWFLKEIEEAREQYIRGLEIPF